MADSSVTSTLSPRERQIVSMIAQGLTNRQIAEEFGLSVFTVRNEVIIILRKLNAKNRSQIAFLLGQDSPST